MISFRKLGSAFSVEDAGRRVKLSELRGKPIVLANHLAERRLGSCAVVHDRSPVGHGYAESFEAAAARAGVELVGRSAISPLAEEAARTASGQL